MFNREPWDRGHPLAGPVSGPVAVLNAQQEERLKAYRRKDDKYKRFLPVALAFAQMSKNVTTKVGAVVLGPGFEVRSSGWNGAPRGCSADEDHRSKDRNERLLWTAHAEANAIVNAARTGTALEGCAIVVTHTPCMSCAKLIVQAGIKTVYSPKPDGGFAERWKDEYERSRRLFVECGVQLVEFDEKGE